MLHVTDATFTANNVLMVMVSVMAALPKHVLQRFANTQTVQLHATQILIAVVVLMGFISILIIANNVIMQTANVRQRITA